MDLNIIIVNWNTVELLRNCLRSIEASQGDVSVKTIVVDNSSSDGSPDMVRQCFPRVVLVNSGGNLGFARGNNLGLTVADAPLVLFLNPDTELEPLALKDMIEFMRTHPDVGGLGCKVRDSSGAVQQLGIQWFPSPFTELVKFLAVSECTYPRLPRFIPRQNPEQSGFVTKLFGACLLVRRSVLDQVGSFDERFFMYCEDVDLCHRIVQAGWKLYYLSEVEILHLGGSASSKASSTFSTLMTCESFSKFMRKHHGRLGSAGYRAAALVGSQARLLMLCASKTVASIRASGSPSSLGHSVRKYQAIARWSLGLAHPVIRS